MPEPEVSVILPAWQSHQTIAACLESLRRQTFRNFEVIVVDSSPGPETRDIVSSRFPEVRLLASPRRLGPHAAKNVGVTLARGRILVFSDPDCLMAPQWLERLIETHRAGRALVGGSIDCAPAGWFEAGVHWTKYPWWRSTGPRGRRPELPSGNFSCSRRLFSRIGPFPEAWYGDTALSRRAAGLGIELWFEPEARLVHDHRASWRSFLTERYERGLTYAWGRAAEEGWSRLRAWAYALAFPALVLWMTAAGLRYVRRWRDLAEWAWCLPVILAGLAARQVGEACGHSRWALRRG